MAHPLHAHDFPSPDPFLIACVSTWASLGHHRAQVSNPAPLPVVFIPAAAPLSTQTPTRGAVLLHFIYPWYSAIANSIPQKFSSILIATAWVQVLALSLSNFHNHLHGLGLLAESHPHYVPLCQDHRETSLRMSLHTQSPLRFPNI